MAPSEPSIGSEKTISVPNARAMSLRALLTLEGITRRTRMPSAAPKIEYATPVLPLVESMRILSFVSFPSRIASCIIRRAARSLTLPPGFANSSFAYTSTLGALDATARRRTSGVLPTASTTDSRRRLRASDLTRAPPSRRARGAASRAPRAPRRRPRARWGARARTGARWARRAARGRPRSGHAHRRSARPRRWPRRARRGARRRRPRGSAPRPPPRARATRRPRSRPRCALARRRRSRGGATAARASSARDRRDDADLVAGLELRLEPVEEAHVLLAHVDVDEAPHALLVEEPLADARVALLEILDDLADGAALGGHFVGAAGE